MKFGFYTAIARRIFLPCILCIPWSLPALGQAEALPDFEREVKPVLAKRCYGCHGAEKQKGKLRLDTMSTDLLKDSMSAERWHEVRAVINLGEMPPEDEPKLTAEERRVILDWLNPTIERAVKLRQSKSGRVVVRRLNRNEYQNTLSDLLGVQLDYTRDFPPDGVSPDGMLNNGSSLQMSDIQLEFYMAAARAALDRVIVTEQEPKVFTRVHMHFVVKGRGLSPSKVERAIKLSAEKYCSATAMIAKTATVTHDFEVVDSSAD